MSETIKLVEDMAGIKTIHNLTGGIKKVKLNEKIDSNELNKILNERLKSINENG